MGLPDSDFVDSSAISDVLKCPVCFEVFDDPVFGSTEDECQHAFCRSCIEQTLEVSEQCPTCRAEVHFEDLKPHWVLRNLLDELPTLCQRRCGWTGRRDARAAHCGTCPLLRLERAEAELAARDASAGAAAYEARLKAAEKELKLRDKRIADLEAQNHRLDQDLINVGGKMVESQVRISDLEVIIQEREDRLREACSMVFELESEVSDLRSVLRCFQESSIADTSPGSPRSLSQALHDAAGPGGSPRSFGQVLHQAAGAGSPALAAARQADSARQPEALSLMLEQEFQQDELGVRRHRSEGAFGTSQERFDRGRLPAADRGRLPAASPRRPGIPPDAPGAAFPPLMRVSTEPVTSRPAAAAARLPRAATMSQQIDEMLTESNDLEM